MTTKAKTVLILGAGASCGYGFPVGSRLRQMILDLRDDEDAANAMGFGPSTLRRFVDAFRASQNYSIDSFLGRRPELVEIGKAAIAYVLLACEQKADLTADSNTDHWYQYLVNELAADEWNTFDPSWLSIVTFNYDRSLPFYLSETLQNIYNKSHEEVTERLSSLKMVHVYGRLGDPFTGIPFGNLNTEHMYAYVRDAARELVIIPEGRDDSPTVTNSQALIRSAERICFLGFGFDETNIRRLGAPQCFLNEHPRLNREPDRHPKITAGTCMGLTAAERQRAVNRLFAGSDPLASPVKKFLSTNCINTLRESLILD